MLGWAVVFLLIALIAAMLGFGGISNFALETARIVFYIAIILFVLAATVALLEGRSTPR